MKIDKGDKFHFIAMGGVGQSALAKILLQRGYEVSGSDISDSKYLKEIKALGGKVFIGHREENLPDDAIVVVSSAIKENNPELKKARRLNLKVLHRSDMLAILCAEFKTAVGFSGTHGKTTTSGLMSYVLSMMKKKPAYAVGGIISGLNTNADASVESDIFIAELDESDGTIVKYSPKILVINNLEADHPDFYKNGLKDVLETFKTLVNNEPDDSKIIVNSDDNGVLELLKIINPKGETVKFSAPDLALKTDGATDKPKYTAENINFTKDGAEFDFVSNGKKLGKISTSLKGKHNVYNALAVACALIEAGYDFSEFAPFFKGFTGMGRRFQLVYKDKNIEIIDDYAHHPSEIKATLQAGVEYKLKTGKSRLLAIFQPHRYTRLKALWDDFMKSFDGADSIIVIDTFSAGDEFDPEFNSENFAARMKDKMSDVSYIQGRVDEIVSKAAEFIKDGDMVLTLGAGDITKLGVLIGENLKKGGE